MVIVHERKVVSEGCFCRFRTLEVIGENVPTGLSSVSSKRRDLSSLLDLHSRPVSLRPLQIKLCRLAAVVALSSKPLIKQSSIFNRS